RSCWRASRVLRRSFRQDLATSLDRKSIGIKTLLVVAEMAVQRQNPVTKETSSWSAWRALGPSTDASAADWVRSRRIHTLHLLMLFRGARASPSAVPECSDSSCSTLALRLAPGFCTASSSTLSLFTLVTSLPPPSHPLYITPRPQ
ncbi:unnamed protein product, partial [Prorocentrum cordatum]